MGHLTAKNGWKTVLAVVIAYEAICAEEELLSRGMDRLLNDHPVWPRMAVLAVALHLVNWLPEPVDPLFLLFHRTKGLGRWRSALRRRKTARKSCV